MGRTANRGQGPATWGVGMQMQNAKGILLETGTNELEILEFFINERVGGESGDDTGEPNYFGVNVAKVMQVIESPQLEHRESATHPAFLGTIPLRQHILPVIDLAVWLGMDRVHSPYDIVVVTEFSQTVTGFLVSGVTEIHRVGWQEVIPPGEYISRLGTQSIIGLVNREDHFVQLLDLESIIGDLAPEEALTGDGAIVRASQRYKALIADDSATIRLLLKTNMEEANFETTIANNGQDAYNLVFQLKDKAEAEGRDITDYVDVVVSDIEMPLMDGFSLTKRIKEDPVLGKLPVILYSSIITKELRHKGESVGADEQVSKPEMDQMAEKAIRLIEARG